MRTSTFDANYILNWCSFVIVKLRISIWY